MERKEPIYHKKILEALLEASRTADKLFNKFNMVDLSELSNFQMASCIYGIAYGLGTLDAHKEFTKNIPDYQQTLTRFEIMKDKFYKEAQRRDGE